MLDSLQVFDRLTVAAVELYFLERLAYQVFRDNRFLAMGFVLRLAGLEIKADSDFVGKLAFEPCQLSQLFTRNHVWAPGLSSVSSGWLKALAIKRITTRKSLAELVSGVANGFHYLVGPAIGDGDNFIGRETLEGV